MFHKPPLNIWYFTQICPHPPLGIRGDRYITPGFRNVSVRSPKPVKPVSEIMLPCGEVEYQDNQHYSHVLAASHQTIWPR